MIIIRRIRSPSFAQFGFNPFGRIERVNKGAERQRVTLQKALDSAKSEGKNLRDPNVLRQVMLPVAQANKGRTGGSAFTRRRKTKKGKIIIEMVNRK